MAPQARGDCGDVLTLLAGLLTYDDALIPIIRNTATRLMTDQALPDKIAAILAPHLGPLSADSVARHLCAKYAVTDSLDAEKLATLRDFLQRGLVAYVGAEKAKELAAECVAVASQ